MGELARDSDFLVVACPGGAATRNLVDRAVLDALGPDGILVNISRGSVIDQQALVAALAAQGIVAELPEADCVLALDTTPETVGLAAAAAGVVIYEMTEQNFDLEQTFLELTATEGAIR